MIFDTYFPTEEHSLEPPMTLTLDFNLSNQVKGLAKDQFHNRHGSSPSDFHRQRVDVPCLMDIGYYLVPLENLYLRLDDGTDIIEVDIDNRKISQMVKGVSILGEELYGQWKPPSYLGKWFSKCLLEMTKFPFSSLPGEVVNVRNRRTVEPMWAVPESMVLVDGVWYRLLNKKLLDNDTLTVVSDNFVVDNASLILPLNLSSDTNNLIKSFDSAVGRTHFTISLVLNEDRVKESLGKDLFNKLGMDYDQYPERDLKFYDNVHRLHPSTFVNGKHNFGVVERPCLVFNKDVINEYTLMVKDYPDEVSVLSYFDRCKIYCYGNIDQNANKIKNLTNRMRRLPNLKKAYAEKLGLEVEDVTDLDIINRLLIERLIWIPVFTPRLPDNISKILSAFSYNGLLYCDNGYLEKGEDSAVSTVNPDLKEF